MLTLPALCVALLAPVAGTVVDFFGRRRTLIVGLLIYAVVGVLPVFLESLSTIIASRIALGIVESAIVTASTTLIGDYFHGESRKKCLRTRRRWPRCPPSCWPVGGALGNLGWRGPFLAYASAPFTSSAVAVDVEPQKSEQPAGARRPACGSHGARCCRRFSATFGGSCSS